MYGQCTNYSASVATGAVPAGIKRSIVTVPADDIMRLLSQTSLELCLSLSCHAFKIVLACIIRNLSLIELKSQQCQTRSFESYRILWTLLKLFKDELFGLL